MHNKLQKAGTSSQKSSRSFLGRSLSQWRQQLRSGRWTVEAYADKPWLWLVLPCHSLIPPLLTWHLHFGLTESKTLCKCLMTCVKICFSVKSDTFSCSPCPLQKLLFCVLNHLEFLFKLCIFHCRLAISIVSQKMKIQREEKPPPPPNT